MRGGGGVCVGARMFFRIDLLILLSLPVQSGVPAPSWNPDYLLNCGDMDIANSYVFFVVKCSGFIQINHGVH